MEEELVICRALDRLYRLNEEELANSCLLWFYRDREECVGFHSDDETGLQEKKPVLITSLIPRG